MNAVRKRNLRILERSRRGESHKDLAQRFNLTRSRIDVIVHEFEEEQCLTDRSTRLLEAIRQANDVDKLWPAEDLIDAIRPLPVTRTRLKEYFTQQNTTHLSLRTSMEMAIPEVDEPDLAHGMPRLLFNVRGVGKKGFWSVINRLTNLDLGVQFKQEWERRLTRLRRDWKIKDKLPYS